MTNESELMNAQKRDNLVNQVQDSSYELLIIGGGVTGCGIALDAASRGIKTVLIEKGDFASGTSSKSTKLIHGGLRYLKQLDIGLVHESGTERAIVNRLAPHLCLPEKMLLPLTEKGSFGKFSTSVGLWVYDFLAKVDDSDKRVMLSKKQTLEKEPLLKPEGLKGSGYYAEYRTDDARLTIELIKKATHYGAHALSYVEAEDFFYTNGKISGVKCIDKINGTEIQLHAKYVVSASGPWVDKLRKKNNSLNHKRLHVTKGVHIVVAHDRLPLKQSVYFDIPDGRMAFAIPRGKSTYIGTTDTNFTGSTDRIVATIEDRDYLLKAVNNVFRGVGLTEYDIISNWAGVRPLIHEEGKSPSELSRKDEIFTADDGLISIAGGKLTGYRKMSERVVDIVGQRLGRDGLNVGKSKTEHIALTPDPFVSNQEVSDYISALESTVEALGLDTYFAWYLVTNYGKQSAQILKSISAGTNAGELELAIAEAKFCIENELVVRAEDFFVRRTGRLYFDRLSIDEIREGVIAYMADQLEWSKERIEEENRRLDLLIKDATTFYESENIPSKEELVKSHD
ncbi:MAG: glycerol-3-phosphate dehydrogenase [Saprospiraceae bacterium]|jgi:glycerol-3-phosphate dehydrogenase